MTGVLDGVVCAVVIVGGTLGARWGGWRWHGWHLRRVHAQHAGPVAVELAPDPYWAYGSMNLEDERDWAARFLPAEPDWREQTMAELGALADPGPGPSSLVPGPGQAPARGNDQGWAGGCAPQDSRPAARADLTGSLFPRHLEDPGPLARGGPGLGPRASAVLERYEQQRQERWALA